MVYCDVLANTLHFNNLFPYHLIVFQMEWTESPTILSAAENQYHLLFMSDVMYIVLLLLSVGCLCGLFGNMYLLQKCTLFFPHYDIYI